MSFLIRLLSTLVWLPFILLWLLFLPFHLVYCCVLCLIATYALVKKGRDVLIIQNSAAEPVESSLRLQELPLSADRVLRLDYASRKQWPWRSLPARLFWAFGPIPMPPDFTKHFLPAVLLLRPFRRPKSYSFGSLSKDRDSKFDELLNALKSN